LNLRRKQIQVLLSDEGRQALSLAVPDLPESGVASVAVEDSDDLGIWIRQGRLDGEHFLLVRWEFVVTIDVPDNQGAPKTLRF
jgi:hypothetical protein